MAKEIERKFLVKDMNWKATIKGTYYHQGYLSSAPERIVRVRIAGEKAFITVKGLTKGASRDEYEYEIPETDVLEMLHNLCEKPCIEKYRYLITHKSHTWEVDEFLGENEGLVVAEVELKDENEMVDLPDWIGKEVTGDPRYFNSNLVKIPFKKW